jgi:chromosome partitioning protein
LRRSMDQALDEQLASAYPSGKRLMVRQDSALAWAGAERQPLMKYEPSSRGAVDLKTIAEWVNA